MIRKAASGSAAFAMPGSSDEIRLGDFRRIPGQGVPLDLVSEPLFQTICRWCVVSCPYSWLNDLDG
jgi:hypothetical protein